MTLLLLLANLSQAACRLGPAYCRTCSSVKSNKTPACPSSPLGERRVRRGHRRKTPVSHENNMQRETNTYFNPPSPPAGPSLSLPLATDHE